MRTWPLLIALLAALPQLLAAQVIPIWSSTESEVIPFDAEYSRTQHALLEDGSGFMVASETRRSGLAGTVHLAANGSVLLGQFGHQPFSGGRLSPEAVLATRGDRVLLAMTELDPPRPLVVLVDRLGQVQWVRPRFGQQARFLDNGDVLLAAGNELMRLKGSNGDLLWVRNLLDLQANAGTVKFQLANEMGSSILLSLQIGQFTSVGDPILPGPAPVLVSLDSTSGALQWQRSREPAAVRVFESCAPVRLGTDQVHAYIERTDAQVDVVIERRRGDTGARLWATRVPAVFTLGDESCDLVATSSLLAFARREDLQQSMLFALNHAGALQWRTSVPSRILAELQPGAAGALLVASQQLVSGSLVTVAESRRVKDGGIAWSVQIPGRGVDWRTVGNELHVAWSGASELQLQRRAAASGALIAEHFAVAEGLALQPNDIEIIDGHPYALRAGLGADQRGVRLRRLDPISGVPVWTQTALLAELPALVTSATLHVGGAGRLVAVVYYRVDLSPLPPETRQAILSFDAGTGALLWQTALKRQQLMFSNDGVDAQPTSTSDGSVYVRSTLCLGIACGQMTALVVRLSAADGEVIWSVPATGNLLGVRSSDLIVERRGNTSTLAVTAAGNGAELWSQLMPLNSFVSTALPTTNGDLHVVREFKANGRLRASIDRRLAADGIASWTLDPGLATASVGSSIITRLADGDLLLSSRISGAPDPVVSRPLLARIDGTSGTIKWSNTPTTQNDRSLTVRAVQGTTGSLQWARGLRFVGDSSFNVEERSTLTTVALDSGSVGVEHQYAQSYDPPLGSPALGLGFLSTVRADRSSLVENRSVDARGLGVPRLQRWPAPGPDQGDLVLRRLGSDNPIRALGPSTEVVFEVEANSTAAIAGISIGFASTVDGLKAQLRGCELVVGTGSCPTELGSSLDQSLSLGAGARMQLRYEIHDPGFMPKQARIGSSARGLFYVNPPFAFGDTDPSNHIVVIQVNLGGMSNGFE